MEKASILIVEDELLIAKDISLILERQGYETTIGITTVYEAIKKIETNSYDLILIDIKLSDQSNGVELGSYLLNKGHVPFIYITSFSDEQTISNVNETRPYGIIIKPFKTEDVLSTVSIVLNNFKYNKIDFVSFDDNEKIEVAPYILRSVVDYINKNIDKRIDLHDLSKLTKWSHQHFIKIFTKYLKQTPYQYILSKKIDKAKVLITTTEMPLTGVAFDLGFQSYSNFFNAFKKETGLTPENYKKQQNIKKYLKKS